MAYRIRRSESVAAAIRRIVHAEAGRGAAELRDDELGRAAAVHQVRKRCKRLRGLLRLVRPALGAIYKRENKRVRNIARELSALRDADAMIGAVSKLNHRCRDELLSAAFEDLKRHLDQHRSAVVHVEVEQDSTLEDVIRQLTRLARSVDDWKIKQREWSAVADGLQRTYARGCDMYRKATRGNADDALWHELRKSVKYHWYHVRLLQGLWPREMKARATELKDLAELLGDDHDLAVLQTACSDADVQFSSGQYRDALLSFFKCRRKQLQRDARLSAARVFAEEPDSLVSRMHSCWTVWRNN